MLFTAASASDFKTGRVTSPYRVTLSPSTRYARLSNTEYHGNMTSWCRTSRASFSRYFSSLRWCLLCCQGLAAKHVGAATGTASSRATNGARNCFRMSASLTETNVGWRPVGFHGQKQQAYKGFRARGLAYSTAAEADVG